MAIDHKIGLDDGGNKMGQEYKETTIRSHDTFSLELAASLISIVQETFTITSQK